jgi:hypothetical protein
MPDSEFPTARVDVRWITASTPSRTHTIVIDVITRFTHQH